MFSLSIDPPPENTEKKANESLWIKKLEEKILIKNVFKKFLKISICTHTNSHNHTCIHIYTYTLMSQNIMTLKKAVGPQNNSYPIKHELYVT